MRMMSNEHEDDDVDGDAGGDGDGDVSDVDAECGDGNGDTDDRDFSKRPLIMFQVFFADQGSRGGYTDSRKVNNI